MEFELRPTQGRPEAGARQTANKEQEKVTPKAVRTTQNKKLLNIYSKITFSKSREILRNKLYLIFIDDYSLNIDNIKSFGSFGLCWPLLAFIGLCGLG